MTGVVVDMHGRHVVDMYGRHVVPKWKLCSAWISGASVHKALSSGSWCPMGGPHCRVTLRKRDRVPGGKQASTRKGAVHGQRSTFQWLYIINGHAQNKENGDDTHVLFEARTSREITVCTTLQVPTPLCCAVEYALSTAVSCMYCTVMCGGVR